MTTQAIDTDGPVDKEGKALDVNASESIAHDWTDAEERKARLKVDLTLLPILGVAFFALQCDRVNISTALTDTITEDLHVTTNQINVGTSLLMVGLVLLEIPSNILLQKFGPTRWLTFQIFAWGLVATFQAFATTYAGYIVTRILLGLCEAGFIPGALYTISTWYKKSEMNLRISIYFFGILLAGATASLIGAGIITMAGRDGISGWRWLFIIEGAITIGIGVFFMLLLPPSVGNGKPLISFGKWSYFTSREGDILVRRVLLDDPTKTASKLSISGREVWTTVRNPRILVHVLISLMSLISTSAVNAYAPSVIKSLGFSAVRANSLNSVGNFVAIVIVVVLGYMADRTNRRGIAVLIAALWCLISFACLRQSVHYSKWNRYAAVVAAVASNSIVHITNIGWLAVNCTTPQQRSIAMAMVVMAANAGGIAGAQVFRTEDAPLYLNAFTALLSLSAANLLPIVAQMAWYLWSNRQMIRKGAVPTVRGTAEEGTEIIKPWSWTW